MGLVIFPFNCYYLTLSYVFYMIIPYMETQQITRQYLESLTRQELIILSEDYMIDVPEDIDRQILIGEILDLVRFDKDSGSDNIKNQEYNSSYGKDSFFLFSEAFISVVFRNPRWAYAMWEIPEPVFAGIRDNPEFNYFFLRVYTYQAGTENKSDSDFFNINLGIDDRNWSIYLNEQVQSLKVCLFAAIGEEEQLIAASKRVYLSFGSIEGLKPLAQADANPLLELSGIRKIRERHFNFHRQTFD